MKRIFVSACWLTVISASAQQNQSAKDSFYTLSPVEVKAIRAGENAPFTKTNLTKKDIAASNLGQDIPFLLNQTASVVVNSDAGNGIGYTGLRIRGTDATRINMTLNGIPYNDAESQGIFFVNLPDIVSSAGSVQIQRGVGTSSNGAGAFGASMNFSTNEWNPEESLELNNSFGSFNSWKNTLKYSSGLVNGFSTDIRLSRISSDGFIDRASSDLKSFYISTAWTNRQTTLRFNTFSGREKTYQAWYGIPETDLQAGNRRVNYAGTEKPGEPYDNETDNYTQTHYQLFFTREGKKGISFNTALFLTRGKGYYEQYKAEEDYAKYNLPYPVNGNDSIFVSDFIRQLWLDNYFYGTVFSVQHKGPKTQTTLGGGLTRYDGRHFGRIIWAAKGLTDNGDWYNLDANKTDFNLYAKQQLQTSPAFYLFYDLQYRYVDYTLNGFRDNPGLFIKNDWHFFNPKAGITYKKGKWKATLSYSVGNKEPNRDDFEAGAGQQPKAEQLHDVEAGLERQGQNWHWRSTLYYMRYIDQLILTGRINDVGAYTRTNIPRSYRAGIELEAGLQLIDRVSLSGNLTLSSNKVLDMEEYIDDYDNGGQKINRYPSATIAFSPSVTGGANVQFGPFANTRFSLISKYVSRQYLDNTGNTARSLDPFFVQDLRVNYAVKMKKLKSLELILQVNNLFNTKYEPNGYTFSYIYGGQLTTENYYFPMAGIHFMTGLTIRL